MNVLSAILQLLGVIVIFLILNFSAVAIMQKEDIIIDGSKDEDVVIFKGWVDCASFVKRQFETYNIYAKQYRNIAHSVNKKGGAQFSYSIWVKFDNISAENIANKVLFIRGDDKKYPFKTMDGNVSNTYTDYILKCPLVRFGESVDKLYVDFNTSEMVNERAALSKIHVPDDAVRHNVFSLAAGKWTLLTFVFEDNVEYGESANGIEFRFYINDLLYHTQHFEGMLKMNQGKLTILPDGGIQGAMIADFTYHNYAMSVIDINRKLRKGVTQSRYNELENDPDFHTPLSLNEYNRLNLYNN